MHPSGVVVRHSLSIIRRPGLFTTGASSNYCIVEMQLEDRAWGAAISGDLCSSVKDGSAVDAVVWRGNVVRLKTAGPGDVGTDLNPSVGIVIGLTRLLALLPCLVFVAAIHYDLAHHPALRRLRLARRPETR